MKGMTYIKMLGVALLALFAFSAVAASTASATLRPTWWVCTKEAGVKEFKTADCAAPEETGGLWHEKELAGTLQIDVKSGHTVLYEKGTEAVLCLKDEATGEIENSVVGGEKVGLNKKVLVKFLECKYVPEPSCLLNGAEADKATIETRALDSILGYKDTVAETVVVDIFLPEVGEEFAPVETSASPGHICTHTGKVTVKGSVIGLVLPQNAFTLLGSVHFEVNASHEQLLRTYLAKLGEELFTDVLTCSFFGAPGTACAEEGLEEVTFLKAGVSVAVKAKPN
jgi:hypothetical protein